MKFSPVILTLAVLVTVCSLAIPVLSRQTRQRVLLHVRVTDAANNPLRDVPQEAFQVTEDGAPQKIELFMNEEVPLTYGLLIDCSGSMRVFIEHVVNAGKKIIDTNKANDETCDLQSKKADRAIKLLSDLATDTGGRTFYANTPADVERFSSEIIKDIRTQYVIGYVPSSGDSPNGARKVLVSLAESPNQEKRIAITRVAVF